MHHLELAVLVCIFGIEAQVYQNRHSGLLGLLAAAQRKLHLDQLAVGGLFGGDVLGGVGGGAAAFAKGCLAARGDGKVGQGRLVALVQLGGNRHIFSRFIQCIQKGGIAQVGALQIVLLFGGKLAGKGQLGDILGGTGLQGAAFAGGFADGSSNGAQLAGDAFLAVSSGNRICKGHAHTGSARAVVGVVGVHGDFIAGAGVQLGVPCFPAELGALGQARGLQANVAERLAAVNAEGVCFQLGFDFGTFGQFVNRRIDLVGKFHGAGVVALAVYGYCIRTGVGAGIGICYGVVGVFGQVAAVSNRNSGLLLAAVISKLGGFLGDAQCKVIRHKALGVNGKVGRGRAGGGVCAFFKAGGHGVAARIGGGFIAVIVNTRVAITRIVVAYLIGTGAVGGACGHRGGGFITIGVICHGHAAAAIGLFDLVGKLRGVGVVALAGHGYGIRTGVGAFIGVFYGIVGAFGHFAALSSQNSGLLFAAVISKLGGAQRKVIRHNALVGNAEISRGRVGVVVVAFVKVSGHGVVAHIGGGRGALGIVGVISAGVGVAYIAGAVLCRRGDGLAVNIALAHGYGAAALGLLNGQGGGDAVQHAGAVFVGGAFKIHANGVFAGLGRGYIAPFAAALFFIEQRKRALGIGLVQTNLVHRGQGALLLVNSGNRVAKAAAGFHGGQRARKDRKFAGVVGKGAAGKGAALIVALAGERVGNFRVGVFDTGAVRRVSDRVIVAIKLQGLAVDGKFKLAFLQGLILAVITAGDEILLHRYFAGVGRNAALGRAGNGAQFVVVLLVAGQLNAAGRDGALAAVSCIVGDAAEISRNLAFISWNHAVQSDHSLLIGCQIGAAVIHFFVGLHRQLGVNGFGGDIQSKGGLGGVVFLGIVGREKEFGAGGACGRDRIGVFSAPFALNLAGHIGIAAFQDKIFGLNFICQFAHSKAILSAQRGVLHWRCRKGLGADGNRDLGNHVGLGGGVANRAHFAADGKIKGARLGGLKCISGGRVESGLYIFVIPQNKGGQAGSAHGRLGYTKAFCGGVVDAGDGAGRKCIGVII